MMPDPFDLDRFVRAQDGCREAVLDELRRGRKSSHWMWFVFPQIAGLGRSAMAARYAIGSRAEAEAYLQHPVLGPRLVEAAGLAVAAAPRSAHAIFGSPDDMKFHSCVTLFDVVAGGDSVFAEALRVFFDGRRDAATIDLSAARPAPGRR